MLIALLGMKDGAVVVSGEATATLPAGTKTTLEHRDEMRVTPDKVLVRHVEPYPDVATE